ncbi:uncharacterized protein LOC127250994 [Andrographis paniculata]|uniref:uncharacterized protein LOC127250994 n=1 Tax=Andrographis paniculata TaxID=175694 RepID=UPI0021E95AC1|nr:uncharacterized protein LOC127250994 [Andrographis paniculata]
MAQELDDGEFWLPSDFLTDDDLLMDFKPVHLRAKRGDDSSQGVANYCYFNSDLSSPVESVNGSTETESDEDEYITALSRKMANSTLQDFNFSYYTVKNQKLSTSPQSTLYGYKQASSGGSPESVSRVSSPPAAAAAKDAGWEILCAAAGEVSRMQLIEDNTTPFHSTRRFASPPNPNPSTILAGKLNANAAVYLNQTHAQAQHLAYLQLQASQFQRMEQQMMNGAVWGQSKIDSQFLSGRTVASQRSQALSMAAWPTLQQSRQQQLHQSGSGMRAYFLGGAGGAKKERTGTGVFLPRRFTNGSNAPEPRKKPGCSTTALLPDRVVQALNLNIESIEKPQSHIRTTFGNLPSDYASVSQKINQVKTAAAMAEQRSFIPPQRVMHQEFRLPQEWTY